MAIDKPDAVIVFGVSGDLAQKKIFPALQALVRRGDLKEPVIGVPKTERSLEQIQAIGRKSVENHGGVGPEALARLIMSLLRHVSGDYQVPSHF